MSSVFNKLTKTVVSDENYILQGFLFHYNELKRENIVKNNILEEILRRKEGYNILKAFAKVVISASILSVEILSIIS